MEYGPDEGTTGGAETQKRGGRGREFSVSISISAAVAVALGGIRIDKCAAVREAPEIGRPVHLQRQAVVTAANGNVDIDQPRAPVRRDLQRSPSGSGVGQVGERRPDLRLDGRFGGVGRAEGELGQEGAVEDVGEGEGEGNPEGAGVGVDMEELGDLEGGEAGELRGEEEPLEEAGEEQLTMLLIVRKRGWGGEGRRLMGRIVENG